MKKPTTFVIVPTYNEADNLNDLISQLLALPINMISAPAKSHGQRCLR